MLKKIFVCLVILFGTLIFVPIYANGDNESDNNLTTTTATGSDNDTELVLENMTNEELEALCTIRGFELVKELDENGNEEKVTREDYIDAAKQCLEIESEMEKILEEHPHLLDEIEAEAARMKNENETLHQKLKEIQDEMEAEKEKAGEKFKSAFINDDEIDDSNTDNSGDGKTNENEHGNSDIGDDHVDNSTTSNNGEINKNEGEISESIDTKIEFYGDDNEEVIDLDENTDESAEQGNKNESEEKQNNNNNDDASKQAENANASDGDNCSTEHQAEKELVGGEKNSLSENQNETNKSANNSSNNESTSDASQLSVKEEKKSSPGSMLTLKDFAIEFRNQIQQDINSVGAIIFPEQYREPTIKFCRSCLMVVKDCANSICDMVKRYGSILFSELFNNSGAAQNDSDNQNTDESSALAA